MSLTLKELSISLKGNASVPTQLTYQYKRQLNQTMIHPADMFEFSNPTAGSLGRSRKL